MDEFTATLKAREFVAKVAPSAIPVLMQDYLDQIGATLKVLYDLGDDEDGFSAMKPNGKFGICVNGNQKKERQRFTICHELAHIILGLPSQHGSGPSWSYAARSPNEIICDVFAAELLLPHRRFKPLVDAAECSLDAVNALAKKFEASLLATGSRFATMIGTPCAFVLAEQGKVRFSSRSAKMRDARGWIPTRMDLPEGSLARRCRDGDVGPGPEETDPKVWFDDWDREGTLYEDARHLSAYDQTIALLWFEDDDVPLPRRDGGERRQREEEEFGLAELDGELPWPGSKKRRR